MDGEMVRMARSASDWLKKHSFALVLLMSLFHIGLAYIHVRDSG